MRKKHKDTERLDFCLDYRSIPSPFLERWFYPLSFGPREPKYYATPRAAIDAAMRAAKKGGK